MAKKRRVIVGQPHRTIPLPIKLRDEWTARMTLDTCPTALPGQWETALKMDDGEWDILEQYDSEEAARAGHERWAKKLLPEKAT